MALCRGWGEREKVNVSLHTTSCGRRRGHRVDLEGDTSAMRETPQNVRYRDGLCQGLRQFGRTFAPI